MIASGAKRVTDNMLMASSNALADCSPLLNDPNADLLPAISEIQAVSKRIAFKVAQAAIEDGVALNIPDEVLLANIEKFWKPEYRTYKRVPF